MPNRFNKIGIAGTGLIGGSFARAFARKGITVYGFDKSREVLSDALKSDVFESLTDDFNLFIEQSLDLVYICLPVKASIEFIKLLGSSGYKGAVTDGCSTKSSIVLEAEKNNLNFCGGHPIRGRETSGFINSSDDLFDGAKHILTECSDKKLLEDLKNLHESIGMNVHIMTPDEHDSIFANVSHLPHLISFCLMDTVLSENKEALSYAGGGFKDFTRIAASDPSMWRDIFVDNKKAIISAVENLERDITKWKNLIKEEKIEELYKSIEKVSGERRKL